MIERAELHEAPDRGNEARVSQADEGQKDAVPQPSRFLVGRNRFAIATRTGVAEMKERDARPEGDPTPTARESLSR